MKPSSRTWTEIDLAALRHNLTFARQYSGHQVMAILKANAYGHGIRPLAKYLDAQGLPYFGIANCHEAQLLTEAGCRTPLFLLGATTPEEREIVVQKGWTPCLSSLTEIEQFTSLCHQHQKTLRAHLAFDTGMGRGGFLPSQLTEALNLLSQPAQAGIELVGIGSHLPSADEDPEFTREQFQAFDKLVNQGIELRQGRPFPHVHLANSAGLLDYTSCTTNLVRPGLLLYGISPLPHWQSHLIPVMTLRSRVSLVRTLPAGQGISYGRSAILKKETRVATIGIGYGDGYPRSISQAAEASVIIHNQRAPLLGRITMDQIMVDVSEIPEVTPGDEVELFGKQLPLSEVSAWAGTIPWEILTRITPRVERHYLNQEEFPES